MAVTAAKANASVVLIMCLFGLFGFSISDDSGSSGWRVAVNCDDLKAKLAQVCDV